MSLYFTGKPAPFAYFTVIAPRGRRVDGRWSHAEPIRLDEPVREYQLINGVWEPQLYRVPREDPRGVLARAGTAIMIYRVARRPAVAAADPPRRTKTATSVKTTGQSKAKSRVNAGNPPQETPMMPPRTGRLLFAAVVLGTLLAHDRALRLFDRRTAVVGQLPLLNVDVGLHTAGLLLLFAA